MADLKIAADIIMHQEDATESGVVTVDRGGRTRFGIAERFHPELSDLGFFDDMPKDEAEAKAEDIIEHDYLIPVCIDRIESQEIANKLASMAVNEGCREAVTLLQRACNSLGTELTEDGEVGPATLAAINILDPDALLARYKEFEVAFYQHIAANNPDQAKFLHGWVNRANA